jgi:Family of unknown function (DUF6152)
MARRLDLLAACMALTATGTVAAAHHSFATFDQAHPIELVGIVQDFRFANPHAFIVLQVKGEDTEAMVWQLEGESANSLAWSGWSNRSLRPGDQLRVTVEPLRSGAPGGSWSRSKVRFLDGSPVVSETDRRPSR